MTRPKNPPTKHPQCGTSAGYHAHWRAGEYACEPCLKQNRKRHKERRKALAKLRGNKSGETEEQERERRIRIKSRDYANRILRKRHEREWQSIYREGLDIMNRVVK